MEVLIVIPARGGSKGIPRKNLRSLGGKPLLWYSINSALKCEHNPSVYVSTDDEEIAQLARKFDAKIHPRDSKLAEDATTLDPVIYSAMMFAEKEEQKQFDVVVTLQPTSPLLKTKSLNAAITILKNNNSVDCVISAVNDTHLTWLKKDEGFTPNYSERVNRQYLPQIFKETGGFFISKRTIVTPESRIGGKTELFELSKKESIDIDTFEDWNLCEYYLKRKKILFNTIGYPDVGMGHIYRTLLIANEILNHEIVFLVCNQSNLGYDKIAESNYKVVKQEPGESILTIIDRLKPDLVINDCLDTDIDYILELKSRGIVVVNFEDLGSGSENADLVINALYHEKFTLPNHYFGQDYFCARDEFIFSPNYKVNENVSNVLITFGGTDPENLTRKTIAAVYDYCKSKKITITVVAGLGYQHYNSLTDFKGIEIKKDIKNISDEMLKADVAFTSAGRTVYELALLGVPSIVLAQNKRETTHYFADSKFGFANLGLGAPLSDKNILAAFKQLSENYQNRLLAHEKMVKAELKTGKAKIVKLILELL